MQLSLSYPWKGVFPPASATNCRAPFSPLGSRSLRCCWGAITVQPPLVTHFKDYDPVLSVCYMFTLKFPFKTPLHSRGQMASVPLPKFLCKELFCSLWGLRVLAWVRSLFLSQICHTPIFSLEGLTSSRESPSKTLETKEGPRLLIPRPVQGTHVCLSLAPREVGNGFSSRSHGPHRQGPFSPHSPSHCLGREVSAKGSELEHAWGSTKRSGKLSRERPREELGVLTQHRAGTGVSLTKAKEPGQQLQ